MAFDFEGALKEGYSVQEISDHLKFNYKGAVDEGYSDDEIIQHLRGLNQKQQPQKSNVPDFVKNFVAGPEAVGSMILSTPNFIESTARKVGSYLSNSDLPEDQRRAAAEEAASKSVIPAVHPYTEQGKVAEQGLGELFGAAIHGVGSLGEAALAGQTFLNDPSARNTGDVQKKYPEALKQARNLTELATEAGMVAEGVKGGASAVRNFKKAKAADAVEAELRARKEAKQAAENKPVEQRNLGQQADMFEQPTVDRFGVRPEDLAVDENGHPFDAQRSAEIADMQRPFQAQRDLFESPDTLGTREQAIMDEQRVRSPYDVNQTPAELERLNRQFERNQPVGPNEPMAVDPRGNVFTGERTALEQGRGDLYTPGKDILADRTKLWSDYLKQQNDRALEVQKQKEIDAAYEARDRAQKAQNVADQKHWESVEKYWTDKISEPSQRSVEMQKPGERTTYKPNEKNILQSFRKKQAGAWTPFASSSVAPNKSAIVKQHKTLENFLKTIPDDLRTEAIEMWREAGGKVSMQSPTTKAISNIPGVKEKLKYMLDPESMNYDNVRQRLAGVKDISEGQLRNNVMSAGQMMSQFFKNDAITWSIGMVKSNIEQARIRVREIESDISKRIAEVKKVGGNDQLIEAMSALAEGRDPKDLGPKAKMLYDTIRKHNDDTYKLLNEEFKLQTGRDLPRKESYFTHSWTGPWGFEVYALNEKGNRVLIDVVRERTRKDAEKALEWINNNPAKDPNLTDLQIGEIKYNSKFDTVHAKQDTGFIEESIQQMLNLSAEGSKKAKEAQQAFRDHFKVQTGVGGYLGNKPWKDARSNMADAVDAFNSYTSAATTWSYGKKAQRELNKFINDKEIDTPRAKALAQEYYNNAFSRNKQMLEGVDAMTDFMARKLGTSKQGINELARNNKSIMTMLTLAYNPRFLMTQFLQPLQSVVPKMLEISAQSGNKASHSLNFVLGMVDGMSAGKLTKEGRMLRQAAKDMHITDTKVIEHLEGFTKTDKLRYYTEEGLTVPNKKAEEITRFWAFSTLYRTAKDVGLSEKDALSLAKNQVQNTMTSYEMADRPLMYGKMGMLGETASNLRTYQHNQYTALVDYFKQGKNQKHWAPFVAQVSTQAALAGAIGFFGFQLVEQTWDLLRKMDSEVTGGKMTKDMPSATEALINHAPDWVTFGGLSGITGYDLGASFSAAQLLPESGSEAAFPLLSKELDMIHSGFNALSSWDNAEDWGVFMEKSLPTGFKGIPEKFLLTKKMGDKEVKVKSAIDPTRRFAEVDNPDSAYYRDKALGTKTLELTKTNKLKFEDVKAESQLNDRLNGIEGKILKSIDAGDKEDTGKYFQQYVDAGGDADSLRGRLSDHIRKRAVAEPYGQLLKQGNSYRDDLRNKRIIDRFGPQRGN